MKQQYLCVLFYSKYSKLSNEIIDVLNSIPEDIINMINIHLVSIDNEKTRSRIINDKKIKITFVPCIIIVYNDGNVEKYEGNTCLEWINTIVSKYIPSQEENEEDYYIPPKKSKKPSKKINNQNNNTKQHTSINDLDDNEEEQNYEQNYEQEIEEENDNEEDEQENIKPPATIRNDAGNYTISSDFKNEQEEENRDMSKHIKSNTSQSTDILSAAAALRKEREEV